MLQKASVIFERLNVRQLSRISEVKLTLHLAVVRLLLEYCLVLVSTLQDGYWWIGQDSEKTHMNAYRLGKRALLWKTQATLFSYQRRLIGWPDCSLNISAGGRERAEGINLIRLCSVTSKGETMTGSSNKTNSNWKWSANLNTEQTNH